VIAGRRVSVRLRASAQEAPAILDFEVATLRYALRSVYCEYVGRACPKTLRQRVVSYAQRAAA
jgi:hypothetical protein